MKKTKTATKIKQTANMSEFEGDADFGASELPADKVRIFEKAMSYFTKDDEEKRREMIVEDDAVPGTSVSAEIIPIEYSHVTTPPSRTLRTGTKSVLKTPLPGTKKRAPAKRGKTAKPLSPLKKDNKSKKAKTDVEDEKPISLTSDGTSTQYIDKEGVCWDGPIFVPSLNKMSDKPGEDPVHLTTLHLLNQFQNRGVLTRYRITEEPEGWRVDYRYPVIGNTSIAVEVEDEIEKMEDDVAEPDPAPTPHPQTQTYSWSFLNGTFRYPSRYTAGEHSFHLPDYKVTREVIIEGLGDTPLEAFFDPRISNKERALFGLAQVIGVRRLQHQIAPAAFENVPLI
nr:MAG: hypothetical protein [Rhabdoviridae sp.]